jgi:hypothetical protein
MHRRAFALPALLVAAAMAISACGGNTPALTDPSEILTKAVESLQNVKTVHLEASVEGTVNMDLTGTGGGDIGLTGTNLVADIDVEEGNLTASVEVPAMLGMTADVVVIGEDTYTRTSFTGELYSKAPLSDAGIPLDAGNADASLEELKTWLEKPEVGPTKLGDASCGSKSCYQVQIDLSADEIVALVPGSTDLGDAQIILTVLVEMDSLRPASFVVKAGATGMGEITLTLALTKWDEGLTITAPPADQVQ